MRPAIPPRKDRMAVFMRTEQELGYPPPPHLPPSKNNSHTGFPSRVLSTTVQEPGEQWVGFLWCLIDVSGGVKVSPGRLA